MKKQLFLFFVLHCLSSHLYALPLPKVMNQLQENIVKLFGSTIACRELQEDTSNARLCHGMIDSIDPKPYYMNSFWESLGLGGFTIFNRQFWSKKWWHNDLCETLRQVMLFHEVSHQKNHTTFKQLLLSAVSLIAGFKGTAGLGFDKKMTKMAGGLAAATAVLCLYNTYIERWARKEAIKVLLTCENGPEIIADYEDHIRAEKELNKKVEHIVSQE